MILESRVVNDMSEPFKANMSLADVRMPVHSRIEGCFGIVQMKRENLLQSDELLDFANGFTPALRCSNVVSRREQMGGIETNPQAFRSFDLVIDRRQVL